MTGPGDGPTAIAAIGEERREDHEPEQRSRNVHAALRQRGQRRPLGPTSGITGKPDTSASPERHVMSSDMGATIDTWTREMRGRMVSDTDSHDVEGAATTIRSTLSVSHMILMSAMPPMGRESRRWIVVNHTDDDQVSGSLESVGDSICRVAASDDEDALVRGCREPAPNGVGDTSQRRNRHDQGDRGEGGNAEDVLRVGRPAEGQSGGQGKSHQWDRLRRSSKCLQSRREGADDVAPVEALPGEQDKQYEDADADAECEALSTALPAPPAPP